MLQGPSYRLVLNPQASTSHRINQIYRQRYPTRLRIQPGRFHLTNPSNHLSMKVLVWNCRGVGNNNFRHNFTELTRIHCPSITVLVETKIFGQRAVDVSSILGFDSVCRSEAEGFHGRIWLLWHSWEMSLDVLLVTN